MLLFNQDVFDEVITGSTTTWYTSASFNALLGAADNLLVLAYPTGLGTTTPSLQLYLDTSADGQHWYTAGAALISGTLAEGKVLLANALNLPAFGRFRMTQTGSSTVQCRLKLTVTGRAY